MIDFLGQNAACIQYILWALPYNFFKQLYLFLFYQYAPLAEYYSVLILCFLPKNYFSWSPAGVIKSGRNPATYRYHDEVIHVDGKLSAIRGLLGDTNPFKKCDEYMQM